MAEEERGFRETVKKPEHLGNHDQPLSHYLGSNKENEKTCSVLDRVQHNSYSMLTIPVQRITLGTRLEVQLQTAYLERENSPGGGGKRPKNAEPGHPGDF